MAKDPQVPLVPATKGAEEFDVLQARLNRAVKAVIEAERALRLARVAERNARKDVADATE